MRFMILVPANKDTEAGVLPNASELAAMGKFNEELVKAGILLAGDGLQASSKGARIAYGGPGKKPVVQDGPFADTKGLIAGYWLLQVKSKEEAVAWLTRAPFGEGVVCEVRQVFDPEDFAPVDPTGELRAKEEELRKQAAAQNAAAK